MFFYSKTALSKALGVSLYFGSIIVETFVMALILESLKKANIKKVN